VSIKGGSYARFRHALVIGNLTLVRAAAAELPYIDLGDALAICLAMGAAGDERYDRAAARWLARLVLERPSIGLPDLERALTAFRALPRDPRTAKRALRDLSRTYGLGKVIGLSD
jgi:hypothetical protein